MGKRLRFVTIFVMTIFFAASCSSGSRSGSSESSAPTGDNNASLNKDDYPVFPDADAGADPAVTAEQGGKGFTGEGWETNTTYDLIGDPRAHKGGVLRRGLRDFPSTLRYWGPNHTVWNLSLHYIVYETLLNLHPTTLGYIPGLATHWQISPDKKTFRFRINPNARFSDGNPVTSDDVVASWKLATDTTLQDPGLGVIFSKLQQPVAESKYIVRVQASTESWQNFLQFATYLFIYPAHVIKNLDGAAYIQDYNYKMLPGTGPYKISEQDVDKGKGLKTRRRTDYWAHKERRNVGAANFDVIEEIVVRDRGLEFEKFKKGDLDIYQVNRASMWVEELDYENIKRGLNQKRKIFNQYPQGVQGLPLNTRREPLNDIRVRKALRYLFPREAMIEKLMFNQYVLADSIYPGSPYENPDNEKIRFDPAKAVQLLTEAGWKDRDSGGRLVKNGRPLSLEVLYFDKVAHERILTPYQEELRKVGITLDLRLMTWETMIKLLDERTFDMLIVAYTGQSFPTPDTAYLSTLADQKNSNNLIGFKNKRADEIINAYNKEFDQSKRVKLLRELDGLVTNSHSWILEWTAPYERVVYWHKFGQPKGYLTRIGSYSLPDISLYWWIDPERAAKLEMALKDSSVQLGEGPSEDKYWEEFAKAEELRSQVTK